MMKPSIIIAIVLCAHMIHAENDEYHEPYNTGVSIDYGRSMMNGFQGDRIIVVSEQALIDPLTFDLSLLVTGDQEILKGNPGIGLGAVQIGCRGSLIRIGPLRLSIGIAGGGVLLKEIGEDRETLAMGGIVTGINEISLNFSNIIFESLPLDSKAIEVSSFDFLFYLALAILLLYWQGLLCPLLVNSFCSM